MRRSVVVACGVFVAGSLLLASPAALAQRAPHSGGGGARAVAPSGGGGGHAQAVPRGGPPGGAVRAQAVPRGARPVGGRPVVGTAVPRGSVPGHYYPPYNHYPYHPYYPYYGYPYYGWGYPYYGYGYGYPYWGWGVGLSFYYNSGWWGFGGGWPWYGYGPYGGYGYPYWGYGAPYVPDSSGSSVQAETPTGHIELKVKPKEAQVYVDGYFVGSVQDFEGWGKRLTVKAAPEPGQVHKIEFRYPGYETLNFEVSMMPAQSITYRGELKKVATEQPKR